ncbi:lysylphosphatidylglycerol synthase transmembrane domain-containing protein, partial [Chloroflexota bacterium]
MDQAEKVRNRILNLVKVVVSLTGLAIVLLTQDISQAVALLLQMDWLPFLIALLLSLSGVPVRAYRWGSLAWALGVKASWWRLVGLWFVGSFFNLFLPTGLGGDAVKMYELSRDDGQTAAAISSVVVDRFLGLFVLFAMALLALAGGYERVTLEIRLLVAAVFVGCVVGILLVLQRAWLEAWGRKLRVGRLLGRVRILRELWESLHIYGPLPLLRATAASVVFNLTLILGVYFLGLAVGMDLSLWYYFLFVP